MSNDLREVFARQAEWRREKAAEFSNDRRNIEAADLFVQLAKSACEVSADLEGAMMSVFREYEYAAAEKWSEMLREVGFNRWPKDAQKFVRDFIVAMTGAPAMTLREWIDIHKDLDAYIASGGKLLELPINSIDQLPPAVINVIAQEMGPDRLARLGRFNKSVGQAASFFGSDVRIGDILTEDRLREIWRSTAN